MEENLLVCPHCGHHLRMNARSAPSHCSATRAAFEELWPEMTTQNPIGFPGYEKKLAAARSLTGRPDGVVCGTARIGGEDCALFVMDAQFMMGSMGTVVGEKITRTFELAAERSLPVVGCDGLRRRTHAGGHPLPDADGQDQRRGASATARPETSIWRC